MIAISIDELLRPYEFEFFRNGLIVATVAGALCGLIGCYVVLRSMSYIGHGLSHSIFGGFAAASLLGVAAAEAEEPAVREDYGSWPADILERVEIY